MDQIKDIADFHFKFKQGYAGSPRFLDRETFEFRFHFMLEELIELRAAYLQRDMTKALDALVDLDYVLKGTVHQMGLDQVFPEAWRRVQAANMLKELAGTPERSKRGNPMDIIKPPGWAAPDFSDLV